jgi:hypothetical protein
MPIAGTIAWAVAGVLGSQLRVGAASLALFFCTGMIFPLGILIARFVGEDVLSTRNDLDRLFGLNVMMANLVWALAIPFWLVEPTSLPLSIGVLAGLMWVPFSWMLQHWVGLFHGSDSSTPSPARSSSSRHGMYFPRAASSSSL